MSQGKEASVKKCNLSVIPDQSGRGYKVKVIGDCGDELQEIKDNIGPQGWRYLEKRLIRDK